MVCYSSLGWQVFRKHPSYWRGHIRALCIFMFSWHPLISADPTAPCSPLICPTAPLACSTLQIHYHLRCLLVLGLSVIFIPAWSPGTQSLACRDTSVETDSRGRPPPVTFLELCLLLSQRPEGWTRTAIDSNCGSAAYSLCGLEQVEPSVSSSIKTGVVLITL